MDAEFAEVVYRALVMIVDYMEKRWGFGKRRRQRIFDEMMRSGKPDGKNLT